MAKLHIDNENVKKYIFNISEKLISVLNAFIKPVPKERSLDNLPDNCK